MGAIFGTDGIRGVVGEDLTFNMALSCGNAIAKLNKNKWANACAVCGARRDACWC